MKPKETGEKIATICENRRARFDYEFDDFLEAGLALTGSEVKALRAGLAHLSDAHAYPENDELYLNNAHIGVYAAAASAGHLPTRKRKLLLHRSELDKWASRVRERGYAIIPISMYFRGGKAKVRLGLGRGRKHHDRRAVIKERDERKEMNQQQRRR